MVDSINNNGINELQTSQLGENQHVARANRDAAGAKNAGGLGQLFDMADISEEAKARLDAEKATQKYANLINREDEEFDLDKVTLFKNMLDSGKINQYLSSLGDDTLADALLKSPVAAALR